MTCVVGLVQDKTVYMGADSAAGSGFDIVIRQDKKVFINDGFLIGFTSSFRMGQILQYSFKPPKYREGEIDLYKYMVTSFIDGVRKTLTDGGYNHINNNVETGGCFLVGYKGRLFIIDSDFQVGESSNKFDSIGCGQSYALGSLATSNELESEQRVKLALNAAEKFSSGVRGPFTILKV